MATEEAGRLGQGDQKRNTCLQGWVQKGRPEKPESRCPSTEAGAVTTGAAEPEVAEVRNRTTSACY